MPVFVLVALALALVALGAVAVAVRQLLLAVGRLRAVTEGALQRALPVIEDLQAEAAVAATETEALQERIATLRARGGRGGRSGSPDGPGATAATLE